MLKMIDVLDRNLVESFIHSLSVQTEHLDELITGILNVSDYDLNNVITHFFKNNDAKEIAYALDINQTSLHAIQAGLALKQENIAETAKLVALCLAIETNTLSSVEVANSLEDFPI